MITHRHSLSCAALVALTLATVPVTGAVAQPFVTGSGNTDGYSIAGYMKPTGTGLGIGEFTVVVHNDSVVGSTDAVSVVCNYQVFDHVTLRGRSASFHSAGRCKRLNQNGSVSSFPSDNLFKIVDNGQPGPGADTVDVNLLTGTGITIPGSALVDGNFIVSP